MPAKPNPFINPLTGYGATSVADRCDMVRNFGKSQLQQALHAPGLQATVKDHIHRRLRKLEKAEEHGKR